MSVVYSLEGVGFCINPIKYPLIYMPYKDIIKVPFICIENAMGRLISLNK